MIKRQKNRLDFYIKIFVFIEILYFLTMFLLTEMVNISRQWVKPMKKDKSKNG